MLFYDGDLPDYDRLMFLSSTNDDNYGEKIVLLFWICQ